jgi:hypothetical protein
MANSFEETDERTYSPAEAPLAREIVMRAKARLAELETQRERIRRRIQALRFLSNHRRDRVTWLGERDTSKSGRIRRSSPNKPARASDAPLTVAPQLIPAQVSALRRACRIALLETEHPQSCMEIHERIIKRGSLDLSRYENPIVLLTLQLKSMLNAGDIICVPDGDQPRWLFRRG